MFQNKVDMN